MTLDGGAALGESRKSVNAMHSSYGMGVVPEKKGQKDAKKKMNPNASVSSLIRRSSMTKETPPSEKNRTKSPVPALNTKSRTRVPIRPFVKTSSQKNNADPNNPQAYDYSVFLSPKEQKRQAMAQALDSSPYKYSQSAKYDLLQYMNQTEKCQQLTKKS